MGRLTIGKLAAAAEVGIDEEVAELLRLNDGGGRRGAVRAVAGRRLKEIEQKLAELSRMRDTLRTLIDHCHGDGPLTGCPVIEAVLREQANVADAGPTRRAAWGK